MKEVRPFSSDEHGGIIGSPLSAFEEVKRGSSSGRGGSVRSGGANGMNDIPSSSQERRSGVNFEISSGGGGHKKKRETSLLISPLGMMTNNNETTTPGTVRQTLLTSPNDNNNNHNLNQVRTSLYQNTTSGRDPTPYQYRSHHASDHVELLAKQQQGGRDPPAKSPHRPPATPAKEELSMIRESDDDNNNNNSPNSKYEEQNASITSEVTGFTLPRTPTWKIATPLTARSKTSTANNNNHHSIAVHSPSKMENAILQILSKTRSQLDSLWDIIGVQPEERSVQLSDLISSIETMCQDKIGEEEALVDQFRKEIQDMTNEYEVACRALGMEQEVKLRRDPSSSRSEAMSLQCEYESVAGRLEIVREAVGVAREEMAGCQKRIFEAYRALNGELIEDELEEWRDLDTDLTEERREEFHAKAVELENDVKERIRAVVKLTFDCQNMIRELEIGTHDNAFGEEVLEYCEDDEKIMSGLQSAVEENDMHSPQEHRGKRRSHEMYTVTSLFESDTCMGISSSALERLTRRHAELCGERTRRRAILGELGTAIRDLWVMLRVSAEDQSAFTNTVRGLSMETIRKGKRELERLQELKAVMNGKLIKEERKKIEDLWKLTSASEAEKASFDEYFHIYDEDKFTDELLTSHQEYTAELNEKLDKMRPILDLIKKREDCVSDRFQLEELQKDPERLKGRHAFKQLKEEEKMTKRVNQLPRLTNELEKILQKWYQENKPSSTEEQETNPTLGHFLYNGTPYLETMHTQEHDWKMHKELEEQERHRKRDEERKSKQNSFGSSYAKLPGQKYKPSIGSTSSSTAASKRADSRPRSASNVRAASNPRGAQRTGAPPRPLADVSGSKGNVPRPPSRSRQADKPLSGRNNIPGYRPVSAPRQRF